MPLRLAIFDFDQTLSQAHVFKTLAGEDSSWKIPPPHAMTEIGQLVRIAELEASAEFCAQGGFVMSAFGGADRIARLQTFLRHLTGNGVECIICSRGLVGPVRKCLDICGLLQFFSRVYGNIASAYGFSQFDSHLPPNSPGNDGRYLGSADDSSWSSKQVLVSRCMQERGLQHNDAVFIDDHPAEIESVQGVCPTIQVQPPHGVGQREFDLLLRMLQNRTQSFSGSSFANSGGGSFAPVSMGPLDAANSFQHQPRQLSGMEGNYASFVSQPAAAPVGRNCDSAHRAALHGVPESFPSLLGSGGRFQSSGTLQASASSANCPDWIQQQSFSGQPDYLDLRSAAHIGDQRPNPGMQDSFVRTVPTFVDLGFAPKLSTMLEERENSVTDSEDTRPALERKKKKNHWCCSQ